MPRAFLIKKQHQHGQKKNAAVVEDIVIKNDHVDVSSIEDVESEHERPQEMEVGEGRENMTKCTPTRTDEPLKPVDLCALRVGFSQAVTPVACRRPPGGTVSPLPGPDCPKPSPKRGREDGDEVAAYRPWTAVPRFFHPAFSPTISSVPARVQPFPAVISHFPSAAQYACHGYEDPYRSLLFRGPIITPPGSFPDRVVDFHRLPASACQQRSPGKVIEFDLHDTDYHRASKTRVPTGPPRFQCDTCHKSYSTVNGLSKHREFHCASQVKKEFGCKHCAKTYTSLGALKMHIRTHTLPCKCKLCGKAFSRPWLLQGHLRTHTGEKPFECAHCGRAFADRSNLRAHLQTHSEVKKYNCDTCAKTFSRMSLLIKHRDGGCMGVVEIC